MLTADKRWSTNCTLPTKTVSKGLTANCLLPLLTCLADESDDTYRLDVETLSSPGVLTSEGCGVVLAQGGASSPSLAEKLHSISTVTTGGSWWWLFAHLPGFWGKVPSIRSPPAPFFFKVEISSRTLIQLFRPKSVHSGSAS